MSALNEIFAGILEDKKEKLVALFHDALLKFALRYVPEPERPLSPSPNASPQLTDLLKSEALYLPQKRTGLKLRHGADRELALFDAVREFTSSLLALIGEADYPPWDVEVDSFCLSPKQCLPDSRDSFVQQRPSNFSLPPALVAANSIAPRPS